MTRILRIITKRLDTGLSDTDQNRYQINNDMKQSQSGIQKSEKWEHKIFLLFSPPFFVRSCSDFMGNKSSRCSLIIDAMDLGC